MKRRVLLCVVAVWFIACDGYESANQEAYRQREIVTRGVAKIHVGGLCSLDIYFSDGGKLYINSVDSRICGLTK